MQARTNEVEQRRRSTNRGQTSRNPRFVCPLTRLNETGPESSTGKYERGGEQVRMSRRVRAAGVGTGSSRYELRQVRAGGGTGMGTSSSGYEQEQV